MSQKGKVFQIAIDGPVGAEKSTVAKLVAERSGILYVDTGAMYRAVALKAVWEGIDWNDEMGICGLVQDLDLKLETPTKNEKDGRKVTVILDGRDVSWEIRKQGMGEGASIVSQYPEVRKKLVELQRKIAKGQAVIMEGRDIGTKVLPKANLKIYMDADLESRAKRKLAQAKLLGENLDLKSVKEAILKRDTREMTRKIDPLRPAKGAWILDTTDLSIKEVVAKICQRAESPFLKGEI